MSNDSAPKRIALTGSTGFLGRALSERLAAAGHRVIPLTRRSSAAAGESIAWDPARGELPADALAGIDAVINLAGENVAQRWTDEVKREIRESRVKSTALLARTMQSMESPPRVLLSGSAIGIYGDRGNELLDESSAPGHGFLADVVRVWEDATSELDRADVRVVHLRTGLVLGRHGGALEKMLTPFKLGLGGRIGSGTQVMSWITLDDWTRAVEFLLRAGQVKGPVNLVAPVPVSNAEFTHALGHALGRPTIVAVPETAIRMMFGEMGEATILASQRVVPTRLLGAGFSFRHETIAEALRAVLAD
ncbi:MAG TPA: TIGR01777 family oxidoreductase [Gemmatimonadaceae bacterium]|nr:TIGR01777 family oxidoreductase [Gemmatimonadaceae bacterium]